MQNFKIRRAAGLPQAAVSRYTASASERFNRWWPLPLALGEAAQSPARSSTQPLSKKEAKTKRMSSIFALRGKRGKGPGQAPGR